MNKRQDNANEKQIHHVAYEATAIQWYAGPCVLIVECSSPLNFIRPIRPGGNALNPLQKGGQLFNLSGQG
jgi:hypothetical protein